MQDFKTYFRRIIKDIAVELSDEFDKNFERKAFFDKKWPQTKWPVNKGSLMLRTGAGRRSISHKITDTKITWRSSLPYMGIHNEGGEIAVTARMKSFFWAMYYKASNGAKGGGNKTRVEKLNNEAAIWKSLALMKVGKKIKIPQRRFIGDHPQVKISIQRVMDIVFKELETDLKADLKQKK
jgi:phage gpG-like protein